MLGVINSSIPKRYKEKLHRHGDTSKRFLNYYNVLVLGPQWKWRANFARWFMNLYKYTSPTSKCSIYEMYCTYDRFQIWNVFFLLLSFLSLFLELIGRSLKKKEKYTYEPSTPVKNHVVQKIVFPFSDVWDGCIYSTKLVSSAWLHLNWKVEGEIFPTLLGLPAPKSESAGNGHGN